jgi:hypothetical protein
VPVTIQLLERTATGRVVFAVATVPLPDVDAGYRWLVLGNEIECSGTRIRFVGELTGHLPDAGERASARPPYDSTAARRARREREQPPDELLDEPTAIALARSKANLRTSSALLHNADPRAAFSQTTPAPAPRRQVRAQV